MKALGSIFSLFIVFFLFQNCSKDGSSLGNTTSLSSFNTDEIEIEQDTEVQFTPVVRLFDITTYEGEPLLIRILVDSNQYQKMTYNWYKNGQLIQGTNGFEIDIASALLDDGGQYKVDMVYTEDNGNTRILYSDEAFIDVKPASEKPAVPTFTSQPTNLDLTEGDRLILQAGVVGIPQPTVQWFKDNVEVPGATNAVLTLENAQLGDAGTYHAVATNSLGTVNSGVAIVTVSNLQCSMPNGTMAAIGTSYSTGCQAQRPVRCVGGFGNSRGIGINRTHTCGPGAVVNTRSVQCEYVESQCFEDIDEGG